MFNIFDPCPEQVSDSYVSQRINVQSQMTLNVVSEIFSKIEQNLQQNIQATNSVVKKLTSTLARKCKANDKLLDGTLAALEQRLANRIAENRASVNVIVGELDRRLAALEGLPPAGYTLPPQQDISVVVNVPREPPTKERPVEPPKIVQPPEFPPKPTSEPVIVPQPTEPPTDVIPPAQCGSYDRLIASLRAIINDEKPPDEFARRLAIMIASLKEIAVRDGDSFGANCQPSPIISPLATLGEVPFDSSMEGGEFQPEPSEAEPEAFKLLFEMD